MKKLILGVVIMMSVGVADVVLSEVGADSCSFTAAAYNTNSDGYIYKGTIQLTRIGSGKKDTFYLFNKRGVDYVAVYKNGPYYKLERRMTINNIDYKR